jgi:hypothetical protein
MAASIFYTKATNSLVRSSDEFVIAVLEATNRGVLDGASGSAGFTKSEIARPIAEPSFVVLEDGSSGFMRNEIASLDAETEEAAGSSVDVGDRTAFLASKLFQSALQ